MPYTIEIYRDFDEQLVKEVKLALRAKPSKEKEIVLRINSIGGTLVYMNAVCTFMYFMRKYHKCKVIAQAHMAQSAALLVFLFCDVRQVHARSTGTIHLPIPMRGRYITQEAVQSARQETVDYIARRTKMTAQEVAIYNCVEFNAARMLKTGIATELVDYFR